MLDIKFIRENPGFVINDLEKRQDKEKLEWVDDLLTKDEEYRHLLQENQKLRASRNVLAEEINKLKKAGEDASEVLAQVKALPQKIKESDEKIAHLKEKIDFYLMRLPNILHESVPYGKDDSQNVVVKEWGEKRHTSFDLKSHGELLAQRGLANFQKAADVSGNGFYYLFGDIARLELALISFAIDNLAKKGYLQVNPPLMLRQKPYEGVTDLSAFGEMLYKIEGEDLYLIATSEHPIAALLMGETLEASDLPKKMLGLSPCFRKEVGSNSIDTKGIFRVHHFNKVEMFIFCRPEDSWRMHEELLANAEELLQLLELPYHVVNVCTGDIGIVAAKKYDVEVWMPREKTYREVVSCSNCTAYQATRLGLKFQDTEQKAYVHTLNSTAIATTRIMRAIIENFQQEDGSILIPKALQPYMGKAKI